MNQRTVLLVDDHATTRKLVRLALERAGFAVHEAKDGATALTLMQRHRPAVVLQDLILPDVDGFALAARLRALAGNTPLRLLAFSGLLSNLDGKRMTSAGFDDVISKPIAPSRLVTLIEAHSASLQPAVDTFGANKCVLVVDDDPRQLHLTSFHLTRLGFRVEEACDGEHALALARARKPDIVVSDVLMPRLDGFGLAIAMRHEEMFANTPLVLVTSTYLEPSDRELGMRAGADEFVERTPGLEELVRALRVVSARGPRHVVSAGAPVVSPELEREHARRTARQLERQVAQNSELMRRTSLLSAEQTIMTSLSEAVLQQRDVESALVTALSTCFDAINSSFGALYLFDRHGHLRARSLGTYSHIDATAVATFFGQESWLRALVASDTSVLFSAAEALDDSARAVLLQADVQRAIVVPLVHLGVPLGALFMAARNEDHTVEPEQWRVFAQGIANQITQALALADAFQAREVAEREADQQKRLARDQAEMWRALVEHVPDVVMHLDLAGRVRFISRSPAGQPLERIRNALWCDTMSAECRLDMQTALAGVLRDGQARTIETRAVGLDGALSWFESHLGPVRAGADRAGGEIVGALVVQREVFQKRQTEAQLVISDRMASVGMLAAGVVHEINNPLASVTANLELALREVEQLAVGAVSSELLDELRDAKKATEQVRRIVRDLKVFSHADAGIRQAVDLQRVLDSALRMAWSELRQRARLVKDYQPAPHVFGNEARLGQVFLNLLVNAVQAIEVGAVDRNQITVQLGSDENGWAVVAVRDTGSGIPAAIRGRLFAPFVTGKPAGVGRGLGLSICERIVSELGGTLSVHDELARGTEFRVALPPFVASAAGAPRDLGLGPDLRATPVLLGVVEPTRRARILVVDDEQLITQLVRRTLTKEHDVHCAAGADEAFRLVGAGQRFDVILCDLSMPQMTGMDFHQALARSYPEQAERMVFFTGGAFTSRAEEFLQQVPNHRLQKPIDGHQLRALINDLVR